MPDPDAADVLRCLADLLDGQKRHGAMLAKILEAATAKPPKSELAATLTRIGDTLRRNTEAMEALQGQLAVLPEQIAKAMR